MQKNGLWLSPCPCAVEEMRSRTLLCFYAKVVNYLLKKYTTDQAIAENDAAILNDIKLSKKTPQLHSDDVIAKSCNVSGEYNEGTGNDIIVEAFDAAVRDRLCTYLATNTHADVMDISLRRNPLYIFKKEWGEIQHGATRAEIRQIDVSEKLEICAT